MANLPAQLLELLRCPVTGSALTEEGAGLVSTEPGPGGEPLRYILDEGIPVLLPAHPSADAAGA